jgi:hypothetical protein
MSSKRHEAGEKFSTMRHGSEYTASSDYFHNWKPSGLADVREEQRRGQLPLDLDCANRHVMAASFVPGSDEQAGVFSCVIGALSDETVAVLDRALQEHARVRLLFSDRSLLLEFVKLERKGPQSVRIVGQLVAAAPTISA